MKNWKQGLVTWRTPHTLYISVPFTWLVGQAISLALAEKGKTIVGGPGAILMRDRFKDIAEVRDNAYPFEPIILHNPFATFTTRGCPNGCLFCAVPKIEGKFKEITDFIPRPIVCDNNFLASSTAHFNKVIDALKRFPYVDFNQGLEAKRFKNYTADRMTELKNLVLRFAFDKISDEKYIVEAIRLAKRKGLKNIVVYLLFGFTDTPADALYRAKILQKLDVDIFPMRYRPLNALSKEKFVPANKGWIEEELTRFKSYFKVKKGIYKFDFHSFENRIDLPEGLGIIPSTREQRKKIWDQKNLQNR